MGYHPLRKHPYRNNHFTSNPCSNLSFGSTQEFLMHPFWNNLYQIGQGYTKQGCLIMSDHVKFVSACNLTILIFHQNRTTNTLRVPRKERIASHRLIDFHVAKCTLGSFSNAHLSHEKPTSKMVFEAWHHDIKIIQHRHKLAVLFVPFYGRTSRWFVDYLTCWCVVVCLPLWRSPIVQNLVTFTDPCQGRYSDLPFKCAKSPNPFGPTVKESDIPPPVRHSTLERSCPCEKGSRCLNPNNSGSQIQIHLKDASFRCNTKNSLFRGGTGKVSHTNE